MAAAVTWVFAIAVLPLAVLTACFATELLAGLKPLRSRVVEVAGDRRVVIIVPAHDEGEIIGLYLPALQRAAAGTAEILVVADNCSDDTAAKARALGADVIERSVPDRRGKGFALDFAREHLRSAPPEVVIVIDADCELGADDLERLIAACNESGRPVQATYLQKPVWTGPLTVRFSTFAFFVRNAIRQRGLQRLAGRVNLVGTGMAFPWRVFAGAPLATDNLVEDLELGLELSASGTPPLLASEAVVWSAAATEGATIEQRRRWEGGHMLTTMKWLPALVRTAVVRRDARQLWAAISLAIPPLTLLLVANVAAIALATLGYFSGLSAAWPAAVLTMATAFAAVALAGAWCAGGHRFVRASDLARAPIYLLWKLPLYVGLAVKGAPRQWVRTSRGDA